MKELSDDELRKRLNRINMEKQYEQYVAEENPDKFKKTKKFISDMTGQFVRSVTSKGLEKLSSKLIDSVFKDKNISPTTKWMYDDLSKLNDKTLAAALKRASSENALRKIKNKKKNVARHSELDKARDYLVARSAVIYPILPLRNITVSSVMQCFAERFRLTERLKWKCTGLTH